jgi:hypothetical protein
LFGTSTPPIPPTQSAGSDPSTAAVAEILRVAEMKIGNQNERSVFIVIIEPIKEE